MGNSRSKYERISEDNILKTEVCYGDSDNLKKDNTITVLSNYDNHCFCAVIVCGISVISQNNLVILHLSENVHVNMTLTGPEMFISDHPSKNVLLV